MLGLDERWDRDALLVTCEFARDCMQRAARDARARGAGAVDPGALAAAAVAGPPTDGRVLTPASAVFA